ncbi:hypothetical protein [Bacillus thuringiensis]|uniref:hypothetical protein n=1 Tax=Bacillus thuringiensis TaxID=1428 RepID=UPI0037C605A1
MFKYVIYLSSEAKPKDSGNSYGYWKGKTHIYGGILIPLTRDVVDEYTRKYKSRKRAENMAEKLADRCGYVMSWVVEEIESSQ